MLKIGDKIECTDEKSVHFGKKGTFVGWVANGFSIEFENGETGLFLVCDLKKLDF